jgi:hypothetical protein
VVDAEGQDHRHRARRIRKVGSQLDVPTMPTPAFSHLLRFHFVCRAEKVSELINRPVVSFFGSRVCGTCTEMIVKSI